MSIATRATSGGMSASVTGTVVKNAGAFASRIRGEGEKRAAARLPLIFAETTFAGKTHGRECFCLSAALRYTSAMEHRDNPASLLLPTPLPGRRRAGAGCVVQVLAALVLVVVVMAGVMAIVAP